MIVGVAPASGLDYVICFDPRSGIAPLCYSSGQPVTFTRGGTAVVTDLQTWAHLAFVRNATTGQDTVYINGKADVVLGIPAITGTNYVLQVGKVKIHGEITNYPDAEVRIALLDAELGGLM